MKIKFHILLLLLFLSANAHALIPKGNVTNIKKLTWPEIIDAVSDTYQFGSMVDNTFNADGSNFYYPSDEKYGRLLENGIGQYKFRIPTFSGGGGYSDEGTWLIDRKYNQLCFGKINYKTDDYECAYLFEGFENDKRYLYFALKRNGDFYARINHIEKINNDLSFNQWSDAAERSSQENVLNIEKYSSKEEVTSTGEIETITYFYDDGQKSFEGGYIDGIEEYENARGTHTWWNKIGQKTEVRNYKVCNPTEINENCAWGNRHGDWIKWNDDGQIRSEETWEKSSLISSTNYNYHYNGILFEKETIKYTVVFGPHGYVWFDEFLERIRWYDSGQIRMEVKNKKEFDKKNSQNQIKIISSTAARFWYKNGQKKSLEPYYGGEICSNKKQGDGTYLYSCIDDKNGTYTYWNEDGSIKQQSDYKNGVCIRGDC